MGQGGTQCQQAPYEDSISLYITAGEGGERAHWIPLCVYIGTYLVLDVHVGPRLHQQESYLLVPIHTRTYQRCAPFLYITAGERGESRGE